MFYPIDCYRLFLFYQMWYLSTTSWQQQWYMQRTEAAKLEWEKGYE